jgi:hypothetical protein
MRNFCFPFHQSYLSLCIFFTAAPVSQSYPFCSVHFAACIAKLHSPKQRATEIDASVAEKGQLSYILQQYNIYAPFLTC